MKTYEEYTRLPYKIEVVTDTVEGGYAVSFPELKGCFTTGETFEKALLNAEDAKREWIASAIEDGYPVPEPENDEHYSGQFKIRIPKTLHRRLAEGARNEGISMNQYCLYLLSVGVERR